MKPVILIIIYFWLMSVSGTAQERHDDSATVRLGCLADFFLDGRQLHMELYVPVYILESLYGFHLNHEEIEKKGTLDRQKTEVRHLEEQVLKRLHFSSKDKPLNLKIADLRLVSFSYLFFKIEIQPRASENDPFEFYYDTPASYDKSDLLAVSLYQGQDKSGGARTIAYLYGNRKKLIYREGLLETRITSESAPFRLNHFLFVLFLASGYGLISLLQMMKGNRRAS